MHKELELTEIFSMTMLSLTSAGMFDTPENLKEKSTNALNVLLGDRRLQEHIGVWQREWGPVIYSHSNHNNVAADNSVYIASRQSPKNENEEIYVISCMGTNPISMYGWIDEDFDVKTTVNWTHILDPSLNNKKKGAISRGTYTGLKIQTQTMQDEGKTISQFLNEKIIHRNKTYHLYFTGHSLGGPLSLTTGLYLYDTRSTWDNGCNVIFHIYPFAGATAGNKKFARYVGSRLSANFKFSQRYWNHFDVVPHAWYKKTLKQVPDLYEKEAPPSLMINVLVKAAIFRVKKIKYIHVHEKSPALEAPPKSIKERFLEAAVNGAVKELNQLTDSLIPDKELKKTVNFVLRLAWEHSIAYFELLNMMNILSIMLEDLLFTHNLTNLLTGSLTNLIKKYMPDKKSEPMLNVEKMNDEMHIVLRKYLKATTTP